MALTKAVSNTLEEKRPFLKRGGRLPRKALLVPSCITVVGFFAGFVAIMAAIKGDYVYATKCIFAAIVFDGLDGRVARRLNATTAFGREFDSLSDLVSFGVAPAVLIYEWALVRGADEFGILVSFLFVVCSAARLARFNVVESAPQTTEVRKTFQGLPTPGAAAAIAALVVFFPEPLTGSASIAIITAYVVLLALLMVSSLPFLSIKHLRLTQTNAKITLFTLALFVAFAWYQTQLFLFVGSALYALSGPFIWLGAGWRKNRQVAQHSVNK